MCAMVRAALDVLAAAGLLAHAALVPAGAGAVVALLLPRRARAAAGHRAADLLRERARSGLLSTSLVRTYDGPPPAPRAATVVAVEAAARSFPWLQAAAVCTAASGMVHATAGPHHAAEHVQVGAFFVLVSFLQFAWAARALLSPGPALLPQALALNAGLLALWATSRTIGLPFGLAHHHDEVGPWDLAATGWEVGAVLCCLVLLRRRGIADAPALPRPAVPALAAASAALLVALALAGAPE